VDPYVIREIRDTDDAVLFMANPPRSCLECEVEEAGGATAETPTEPGLAGDDMAPEPGPVYAPRVAEYDNVYLITSMLQDVVKRGTGRRAMALGRKDLSGKTGTTNDQRDAWFCGFNNRLVTTVWVGFDHVLPLGAGETGSRAALPMWVDYMREALLDVPESTLPQPPGLVTVRIDEKTGLRLPSGQDGGIFELFRPEYAPQRYSEPKTGSGRSAPGNDAIEPLF